MDDGNDEMQRLFPRLRFPGFQGHVSTLPLAAVADLVSEKINVEQLASKQYVSTENLLPEFAGMSPATKLPSVSYVTRFQPRDILISNIRPYLKKVWQADFWGGASNDVLVFRAKDGVDADYLASVLRSDFFIDYVMRGAKGLKMPRGEVSLVQKFSVPCPDAGEQRKIADCLSSLDELVNAEAQKLDALKAYKRGLMQQLFPCEGESVPRLRFPEFRKAGDWMSVAAGGLFSNRSEKGKSKLPIYSVTMNEGLVPRMSLDRRIEDVAEPSANKTARRGDIAYNMMRMWQGALGVAPEDCMVSPAYIVLEPNAGVNSLFFYFLLKLPETLRVLTAHSRGLTEDRLRLYYDDFAKIPLLCPSPAEQERIADCLSSLDERIAVQKQRISALKTQKEGLIEQLFPVLDEAQG
ncbi:restriction modification system DNA specificity domain-containing protein [Burkholderia pseudomallei]|uniref:restriction endonuclease subunit S n=1 Tax=Burkholderia TaxID=32008 RepID=UPI0005DCFE9A|nr:MULTISPECIES: restriction endonuclease subunit S [Burkholderia]CFK64742.1 restriction modification system DNA specificity domain-containing protein [Burkholderia pseudomallei]CPF87788.1 restriction modification system DNA specificity domain-containing protein [Burkholderia pseudomallei]CPG42414.1 restriction modification system DNA specificity domain-containing protein [Burkholderia pseudomallei]